MNDFSSTVRTWDGEYTVGVKHLKSYDYLSAECQHMQEVCDCISRLQDNQNLKEAARAVLQRLEELKLPYLTAVEEKLLGLIEKEYGIIDEVPRNSQ